jgi:hypothetical protein
MFRLLSLTALILLLLFGVIIAPHAYALCQGSAHCAMSSDYDAEQTDGPYDPCYNAISWSFEFYRTNKITGSTQIQWKVTNQAGGNVIHREYNSGDYEREQTHKFSGYEVVGSSAWHKLHLLCTGGDKGHFTSLDISIWYSEYTPDRPSGQ